MGFGGVFNLTSVFNMIIWEDQSAKINGNSGIEVVAVHNFLILKLLFWPFQVSFPFQDTQNASDVNFSSRKLTWLAGISPFLIGDTGYIFKWLFFHCHRYFSGGVIARELAGDVDLFQSSTAFAAWWLALGLTLPGSILALLLRKEILHQLRLVVSLIYTIIYKLLYIPGGCLGFLNHQQ